MEIWADIKNYEGLYQISNLGRIKNTRTNHILKPVPVWYGYLEVHLKKDGKRKHHKIHRLVAEAFIPNPDNLPCVNHKDENKHNNRMSNLEWCTYQYNNTYNGKNEKTKHKHGKRMVRCIETNEIYSSITDAGKKTGINRDVIIRCCRNQKESGGGYHWEYYYKLFEKS